MNKIAIKKETLRAQWSSRHGKWRIAKKTYVGSGGWKIFDEAEGYESKQMCNDAIKSLVEKFPEQYKEE